MTKLSKRKDDISFIDPITMEVRCTFNQCVDKFTIEGNETVLTDNGNEFTAYYHACSECGQRVKGRGDGKKGWLKHLERVCSGEAAMNPESYK
jgi:hypothetical protein